MKAKTKIYFIQQKYSYVNNKDKEQFYKLFRFFPKVINDWVHIYEASITSSLVLESGQSFEEVIKREASFKKIEKELIGIITEWVLQNNESSGGFVSLKLITSQNQEVYCYEIGSEDVWYLNLTDEQFLVVRQTAKEAGFPDDLFVDNFMDSQV